MNTLRTPAGQVEWEESGDPAGDAVLLIHGSIASDAFAPLMDQPALAGHRLVRYRRCAYTDGFDGPLPVSIRQDADDALGLLDALGIGRAHLVGHSHGAVIALDLAHRVPERVGSLGLLEAGLSAYVPSAERAGVVFAPIVESYAAGRGQEAVVLLSEIIFGRGWVDVVERALGPGAVERIRRDADATFGSDMPALGGWHFLSAAPAIRQPLLSVLGGATDDGFVELLGVPVIAEVRALLTDQLPQSEHVWVPGTTHLLQVAEPRLVAELLGDFFSQRSPERCHDDRRNE